MREVLEETGWDLEGQLREEDCVEAGWSPAAAATGGGSSSQGGGGTGGGGKKDKDGGGGKKDKDKDGGGGTKKDKLYIVAGLDPDSAAFAPKCKGEIGGYAWHRVADLPCTKDEGGQSYYAADGSRHRFWGVRV